MGSLPSPFALKCEYDSAQHLKNTSESWSFNYDFVLGPFQNVVYLFFGAGSFPSLVW